MLCRLLVLLLLGKKLVLKLIKLNNLLQLILKIQMHKRENKIQLHKKKLHVYHILKKSGRTVMKKLPMTIIMNDLKSNSDDFNVISIILLYINKIYFKFYYNLKYNLILI
jgi:hypothetical protein